MFCRVLQYIFVPLLFYLFLISGNCTVSYTVIISSVFHQTINMVMAAMKSSVYVYSLTVRQKKFNLYRLICIVYTTLFFSLIAVSECRVGIVFTFTIRQFLCCLLNFVILLFSNTVLVKLSTPICIF